MSKLKMMKYPAISFRVTAILVASVSAQPGLADDLPEGGAVVAGEAAIAATGPSSLFVNQSSDRAIIHWDSFSIGAGNAVSFNNGAGATLNRVTGGDASEIHGSLTASGSVFLINENGVLIGSGGVIETGGSFVASTLDIADDDFLDGGDLTFRGEADASVVNLGEVSSLGGDVALLSRTVINEGAIAAQQGTVGLVAGREILLRDAALDDGKFLVKVGDAADSVSESGRISAAIAELKANGGNVYALAGNNDGSINATGFSARGGRVYLGAGNGTVQVGKQVRAKRRAGTRTDGGDIFINADIVSVSGLLDASGDTGGAIDIGAHSEIALENALLDASGRFSGGQVRIGGELMGGRNLAADEVANVLRLAVDEASRIDVSAQSGDGGSAILWSEELTEFEGQIDAVGGAEGTGGFVEVSSFGQLEFHGTVDTNGGTLLLDPTDIEIGTSNTAIASSFISLTTLDTALASNNVVITTHDGVASDEGHIYWTSDYAYGHANSLSLMANGNIDFRASVQNYSGSGGDINLVAGWDGINGFAGIVSGGLQTDLTFNNPFFANADLSTQTFFGQSYDGGTNFGSVIVGNGSQTSGIAVGSRTGATNVYGYDISAAGSNTTAGAYGMLGFHGLGASGDIAGNIFATAVSDVSVLSGTGGGANAAFAQIGHGGFDFSLASAFGNLGGDISLVAGGDVLVQATTGGTFHNYAQIGHGGQGGVALGGSIGTVSGDLAVTASGSVSLTGGSGIFGQYAQIGHLGAEFANSLSSIAGVSGGITLDAGADINLTAGNSTASYAQIGHGGLDFTKNSVTGNISGNVDATAGGNVVLQAGTSGGNFNYVQVGHGGHGGAVFLASVGDVTGDVSVNATGTVSLFAGSAGVGHYAQIGHLGSIFAFDSAVGAVSGDLSVASGSDLRLFSGNNEAAYTQIGHGGQLFVGSTGSVTSIGGDVALTVAGNAIMVGGSGLRSYSQVGHLGYGSDTLTSTDIPASGNITADIGGDLTVQGGTGTDAFAQIGFGGSNMRGTRSGAITITSVDDVFLQTQASSDRGYAHIGHGGANNPDDFSGDISLAATGNLTFDPSGSSYAWTQLGHGGYGTSGEQSGDISIASVADVTLNGGNLFSLAMLGHGGFDTDGNKTGDISIASSGDLTVHAGTSSALGSAQIGHGGGDTDSDMAGDITITASGDLSIRGGAINEAYATVGHGDGNVAIRTSSGLREGDIDVTLGGELSIETANQPGEENFRGWFGHYTTTSSGISNSDWTVTASGFDEDTGSTLASGADGFLDEEMLGNAINGGNLWIKATDSGISIDGSWTPSNANDLTLIASDDITLLSGTNFVNSGSGNIILAAGGNFHNDSGSTTPLGVGTGRWLAYSTRPDSNRNDIEITNRDFLRYATTFDELDPIPSGLSAGNGLIYSVTPLVTYTANDQTITYGGSINTADFTAASGLTVGGVGVTAADFGIDLSTVTNTITLGLAGSVPISGAGFAEAGTHTDGIELASGTVGNTWAGVGVNVIEGDLTVNPAALTVTASDATKTYDGLAFTGGNGVTYSGFVTGEDETDLGGTLSFGGTSQGAVNAGTFGITASGLTSGNYAISFVDGSLTVNQAALTVTATDATKTYDGLAFTGGNGVTYAGFVTGEDETDLGGTLSFGGTSQGAVNAGTFGITASGLTSGNYAISFVDGALTVNPAALTVTANDASKIYDATAFTGGNGVTYSGFVGGEDESVLGGSLSFGGTSQGAVNAGTFGITASGLTSGNYAISFVDGSLTVNPAALTVTANDASKTYDATAFAGGNGVTYSGFVGGEDESVLGGTLSFGGTSQGAVNAGTFGITASGLTSGNYAISFVDGALTVNPAALTVTANDASKIYDATAFTGGNGVTYSGFVGGEDESVLGGTLSFGGTSQGAVNAGTFGITASGLTSGNYAISFVDGSLTVNPAALTVTANDALKIYDATAFAGGNGVTYSGFVGGEDESVLGGSLSFGGTSQGAVEVGSYVISASGLSADNYDISSVDGTLSIQYAVPEAPETRLAQVGQECSVIEGKQDTKSRAGAWFVLRGASGYLKPLHQSGDADRGC